MKKREPIGDEPDGPGPDEVEGDYTKPAMKARPGWNESFKKTLTGNVPGPAVPFDPASNLDQESPTPQASRAPANAPTPAPKARKSPDKAPSPTDTWAGVRADLLANAKADAAAKALAEKKRKEAEAFSASLKGATKRSSTGYDSYKRLMGE